LSAHEPTFSTIQPTFYAEEKEELEFTNSLISKSDLAIGNYDAKIINHIDRFKGTDSWFCMNCTMKGDKWFMMKHPCNNNINKNNFNKN
jgi:hypothetical protein